MGVHVSTSLISDFLCHFFPYVLPFLFLRGSLEKSCTHTIRGKTLLKFQKVIHLELNPSFYWKSCDLNCKNRSHQLKWHMSSAATADEGGHDSWCPWTDVLPLNVNQARFTDVHSYLILVPSCPVPPSLHSWMLPRLISSPFMSPARQQRSRKGGWKGLHRPQSHHSSCWHLW